MSRWPEAWCSTGWPGCREPAAGALAPFAGPARELAPVPVQADVLIVEMRFQRSIWTFEAGDAETPYRARQAVRAFAADQGADAHTLAAVELCVSQAGSNAGVHPDRKLGGPGPGGGGGRELGGRGPVEVEARRPAGYICIYVRDRGSGPRRRSDSPGLGLGLPLIGETATDLDVRPFAEGGTEVLMRFALSGTRVG